MPYTANDVLAQLDHGAERLGPGFPALDHGYYYPGDVRLSAYRDVEHWGIVIETLVCNASAVGGGHSAMEDILYYYGNHLAVRSGMSDRSVRQVTADGPSGKTFASELEAYHFTAVTNAGPIRIHDQVVAISTDPRDYDAAGVALQEPARIQHFELLRWLTSRYRNLLLASDEELEEGFIDDLPLFMRLDGWRHPDVLHGQKPSDLETFQMLADALATGDACRFHPREAPNTHWSNWPMGGSL